MLLVQSQGLRHKDTTPYRSATDNLPLQKPEPPKQNAGRYYFQAKANGCD